MTPEQLRRSPRLSNLRPALAGLTAFSFGLLLGACSERQVDPDYSEFIAETCELSCPVTIGCSDDPMAPPLEQCLGGCIPHESQDDLTQCRSRHALHLRCIATLTCEEWLAYQEAVLMGDGTPDDYPCLDKLIAVYSCDADQPFDPYE